MTDKEVMTELMLKEERKEAEIEECMHRHFMCQATLVHLNYQLQYSLKHSKGMSESAYTTAVKAGLSDAETELNNITKEITDFMLEMEARISKLQFAIGMAFNIPIHNNPDLLESSGKTKFR